MMIGIVVLALIQIVLCGWPLTRQYVMVELPRISRYGEVGTDDMRIATPPTIENETIPPGDALAGGRWQYRYTLLPDFPRSPASFPTSAAY